MPRASTTSDAFNAIAEPRRREIITLLAEHVTAPSQGLSAFLPTPEPQGGLPVNRIVELLNLPQPTVSKHLAVLRKVGLVSVIRQGQLRLYRLNLEPLQPVQTWIATFDRLWTDHLQDIKDRAEKKTAQGN